MLPFHSVFKLAASTASLHRGAKKGTHRENSPLVQKGQGALPDGPAGSLAYIGWKLGSDGNTELPRRFSRFIFLTATFNTLELICY